MKQILEMWEFSFTLVGLLTGSTTQEISVENSQKAKKKSTI